MRTNAVAVPRQMQTLPRFCTRSGTRKHPSRQIRHTLTIYPPADSHRHIRNASTLIATVAVRQLNDCLPEAEPLRSPSRVSNSTKEKKRNTKRNTHSAFTDHDFGAKSPNWRIAHGGLVPSSWSLTVILMIAPNSIMPCRCSWASSSQSDEFSMRILLSVNVSPSKLQ